MLGDLAVKISKFISKAFDNSPSLIILLGVVNGALTLILPFFSPLENFFFIALPLSIIPFIICHKKNSFKFIIFTLIAFLLGLIKLSVPKDHYQHLITQKSCRAIIDVKVTDTKCVSKKIKWMPNPKFIEAEVRRIRYTEESPWIQVSGKVAIMLKVPGFRAEYGDILQLDGGFNEPQIPLIKGGFNFQRYLKTRGINKMFSSYKCVLVEKSTGFYSNMLRVRDFGMIKLADGLKSDDNKRLLAALIYGCRQGLNKEKKRDLILSGTIHIFTVSGFHVGMLALALFWIFRFLPFKTRYLLIPVFIFLYLLMIGIQPAALRAFIMISIFCYFRAFLYTVSPLNVLFLTASILLLLNPLHVSDVGFLYSFVTVSFLIASWKPIREFIDLLYIRTSWIPKEYRSKKDLIIRRCFGRLSTVFAGCLVAWLASSGITLFNTGLHLPLSVFNNILLLPIVWGVFIFSLIKIAFFYIPFPTILIEFPLKFINWVCDFNLNFTENVFLPIPHILTIFVFYIFLVVMINSMNKKILIISFSVILLTITSWYYSTTISKHSLIAFNGGKSQEVAFVIADNIRKKAIIINAPSYEISQNISTYLTAKGIKEIDTLFLCGKRKAFCRGAQYLQSKYQINKIILPARYKKSNYAKKMVEAGVRSGSKILSLNVRENNPLTYNSYFMNAKITNKSCFFVYHPYEFRVSFTVRKNNDGTQTVTISHQNNEKTIIHLSNCNVVQSQRVYIQ